MQFILHVEITTDKLTLEFWEMKKRDKLCISHRLLHIFHHKERPVVFALTDRRSTEIYTHALIGFLLVHKELQKKQFIKHLSSFRTFEKSTVQKDGNISVEIFALILGILK